MVSKLSERSTVALVALFFIVVAAVFASMSASALSDPVGEYQVFVHACTGATSRIESPTTGKSFKAFQLWNNSTTPVFFGGSDVNTATDGTAKGWPICTNTAACPRAFQEVDGIPTSLYCKAGSSVNILIWAAR
jgi:hypothetical protein